MRDRRNLIAFLGKHQSFWEYLKTYQNAFEVLYENASQNDLYVDRIAYPMLFIARHCLELGFKSNIRYFSRYSERNNHTNSDSHDLEELFSAFKMHINFTIKNLHSSWGIKVEKSDKQAFSNFCSEIEDLINQFGQIDKGSFSFRYPVDRSNNIVFSEGQIIDLFDFKKIFDDAIILLYHTADVFKKYSDYANEIQKQFEDEMQNLFDTYR